MDSVRLSDVGGAWEIHALELDDGERPVERFLERIAVDEAAAFQSRFDTLVGAEPFTKLHTFKSLRHENNVWEVLTPSHRILGFRWLRILILTNGFRKKGNETPRREITTCKTLRDQWFKEQGDK